MGQTKEENKKQEERQTEIELRDKIAQSSLELFNINKYSADVSPT